MMFGVVIRVKANSSDLCIVLLALFLNLTDPLDEFRVSGSLAENTIRFFLMTLIRLNDVGQLYT